MSFSVGILYSAQEFAADVSKRPVTAEEFEATFQRYSLAKPKDILEVSLKCNWVDFQADGLCRITNEGREILLDSAEKALRVQICHLIKKEEPTWAVKIPNGRKEAEKFLPQEVHQCFKEAGLLESWDDEVVIWWDRLAIASRTNKSISSLETGRRAEKLTMLHEEKRVGRQPRWQSIESNFSGYDVLSFQEKDSNIPRLIEVKGSSLPRKEAFCYVTRNEWNTAETATDYRFHLWCLRGYRFLIEVDRQEMKDHIPTDEGNGKWETAKVPFKSFTKGT